MRVEESLLPFWIMLTHGQPVLHCIIICFAHLVFCLFNSPKINVRCLSGKKCNY